MLVLSCVAVVVGASTRMPGQKTFANRGPSAIVARAGLFGLCQCPKSLRSREREAAQKQTKLSRPNPYKAELQTSNVFPCHVLPPRPPSAGVAPWLRAALSALPRHRWQPGQEGLQGLLSTRDSWAVAASSHRSFVLWLAMACWPWHVAWGMFLHVFACLRTLLVAKLWRRPGGLEEWLTAPHHQRVHALPDQAEQIFEESPRVGAARQGSCRLTCHSAQQLSTGPVTPKTWMRERVLLRKRHTHAQLRGRVVISRPTASHCIGIYNGPGHAGSQHLKANMRPMC